MKITGGFHSHIKWKKVLHNRWPSKSSLIRSLLDLLNATSYSSSHHFLPLSQRYKWGSTVKSKVRISHVCLFVMGLRTSKERLRPTVGHLAAGQVNREWGASTPIPRQLEIKTNFLMKDNCHKYSTCLQLGGINRTHLIWFKASF